MKIVCISDTHNRHKSIDVGSGDILIHSGDATGMGREREIEEFLKWYGAQDFAYKIFVAGNHDWGFETDPEKYEQMCKDDNIIYLNDSGTTIKSFDTGKDINIWGSPVQPKFADWAFNRRIEEVDIEDLYNGMRSYPWIKPHWDKIPSDTDILITHGPPEGILDEVPYHGFMSGERIEHVGCPHLRKAVLDRIKPKLHVFGHIHPQYGVLYQSGTMFINAAQCNDYNQVDSKPMEILWKDGPKMK